MSDELREQILKTFGQSDYAEVASALEMYRSEGCGKEFDRVCRGIVKLAAGDFDRLLDLVQLAVIDYRDLLVAAEYSDYPW